MKLTEHELKTGVEGAIKCQFNLIYYSIKVEWGV